MSLQQFKCERIEPRQLLTIYTYDIPTQYSSAYLMQTDIQGEVQVRLNSPTGTVGDTFTVGEGMYVVRSPNSGFLFVDRVQGDFKPRSDGANDGIKVELTGGATGGHLRVEGTGYDDLFRVTESSSSGTTVAVKAFGVDGNTRTGAGVNTLTIQTETDGNASVFVATAGGGVGEPDLPGLSSSTSLMIDARGPYDQVHLGGAANASVNAVVRAGAACSAVYLEQSAAQPNGPNGTTVAQVDFDPSLGGVVGAETLLWIGAQRSGINCTATLKRAPWAGNHTITVDEISIAHGTWIGAVSAGSKAPKLVVEHETRVGNRMIVGYHESVQVDFHALAEINAPLVVANADFTNGELDASGQVDFNGTSAPSLVHRFSVNSSKPNAGLVNVNTDAIVTARDDVAHRDAEHLHGWAAHVAGARVRAEPDKRARVDAPQLVHRKGARHADGPAGPERQRDDRQLPRRRGLSSR